MPNSVPGLGRPALDTRPGHVDDQEMHRSGITTALTALVLLAGGCQQHDGAPAPTARPAGVASPTPRALAPLPVGRGLPQRSAPPVVVRNLGGA